jgi:hypothetical protein
MSNEQLQHPEDELSDEQLEQIAGGDGEISPMFFRALCDNETIDKNVHDGFAASKNEVSIETKE